MLGVQGSCYGCRAMVSRLRSLVSLGVLGKRLVGRGRLVRSLCGSCCGKLRAS